MTTKKDRLGPTKYRIRVEGHLDRRWSSRLEGMAINHECNGTTTLLGQVQDQSALHGILRNIRDLNLVLISVRREDANRKPKSNKSSADCGGAGGEQGPVSSDR